MKDLIAKLENHLAERRRSLEFTGVSEQGKSGLLWTVFEAREYNLLNESCSALVAARHNLILMAKLASDKPEFMNPLVVREVKKLRDDILKNL